MATIYTNYLTIRHKGRLRALRAAQADYRAWLKGQEDGPVPPPKPLKDDILIIGAYLERPHRESNNRFSRVRGQLVETDEKIRRLALRRKRRKDKLAWQESFFAGE